MAIVNYSFSQSFFTVYNGKGLAHLLGFYCTTHRYRGEPDQNQMKVIKTANVFQGQHHSAFIRAQHRIQLGWARKKTVTSQTYSILESVLNSSHGVMAWQQLLSSNEVAGGAMLPQNTLEIFLLLLFTNN